MPGIQLPQEMGGQASFVCISIPFIIYNTLTSYIRGIPMRETHSLTILCFHAGRDAYATSNDDGPAIPPIRNYDACRACDAGAYAHAADGDGTSVVTDVGRVRKGGPRQQRIFQNQTLQ